MLSEDYRMPRRHFLSAIRRQEVYSVLLRRCNVRVAAGQSRVGCRSAFRDISVICGLPKKTGILSVSEFPRETGKLRMA